MSRAATAGAGMLLGRRPELRPARHASWPISIISFGCTSSGACDRCGCRNVRNRYFDVTSSRALAIERLRLVVVDVGLGQFRLGRIFRMFLVKVRVFSRDARLMAFPGDVLIAPRKSKCARGSARRGRRGLPSNAWSSIHFICLLDRFRRMRGGRQVHRLTSSARLTAAHQVAGIWLKAQCSEIQLPRHAQ